MICMIGLLTHFRERDLGLGLTGLNLARKASAFARDSFSANASRMIEHLMPHTPDQRAFVGSPGSFPSSRYPHGIWKVFLQSGARQVFTGPSDLCSLPLTGCLSTPAPSTTRIRLLASVSKAILAEPLDIAFPLVSCKRITAMGHTHRRSMDGSEGHVCILSSFLGEFRSVRSPDRNTLSKSDKTGRIARRKSCL